jgi:DNA-binding GntR family transcriptional regulator
MPKLNNQTLGQAENVLEQIDQSKLGIAQHGELNWQFHACLYQAAKELTMFNNIATLLQFCSRYISFHPVKLGYVKTSQQEH